MTALMLVRPVVAVCTEGGVGRSQLLPLLEPLTVALVDKLGDNNTRCREATFNCLNDVRWRSASGCVCVRVL